MRELEPESPELVGYYRAKTAKYLQTTQALGRPRFSQSLQRELSKFLPNAEAVTIIEAVALLGDWGNAKERSKEAKAVRKMLWRDGFRNPAGKRTNIGLLSLVESVTPLLLHFGVSFASSERSHLVLCLRLIGDEMGIPGDPRDELRRLVKQKRLRDAATKRAILDALGRGLVPFLNSKG